MATKKKKPTAAEFSTVNVETEISNSVPSAEALSESDRMQAKAGTLELSISEEIRQKLDSADKLAEENAKYAAQISQLQDRIAEYISEIARLNERLAGLSNADEKVKKLESEIVKLKTVMLRGQPPPRHTQLTPNYYRRRFTGEYPSWN